MLTPILRAWLIAAAVFLAAGSVLFPSEFSFQLHSRSTGGSFSEEGSCTSCHSGVANSGPGSVTVTVAGNPLQQYRYTPGEQVEVVVQVQDAGKQIYGFQATARHPDGCVQAGIFAATDLSVDVLRDAATPEGCSGSTVLFLSHTSAISGVSGTASFSFQWTAPNEDIGAIRWAAAGLAGDGDSTAEGDNTYTIEASTEAASGVAVKPVVNPGGVVLATGTPVVSQLSPGSIATVFGTDFAPDGIDIRAPVLDENQRVQTKVANTCVEVNGKWAPLFAIFPTQINFQIGHDVSGGTADIRVVRGCNSEMELFTEVETVAIVDAAPAFFNFTNAPDGVNPIAALRQDFSILGPVGLTGEPRPSSPAAPEEFVSLFATNLGLSDPVIFTGGIPSTEVAGGLAEVVNRAAVRIRLGGVDLPTDHIIYVGVAPCCAGLYQITFKIPAGTPDGNHQVILTVNGVDSPTGPYIAVKR